MKSAKKWFKASVDFLPSGYPSGIGFRTKLFFVKATSKETARKRIKKYVERYYGTDSLYDLGLPDNRGINNLEEINFD